MKTVSLQLLVFFTLVFLLGTQAVVFGNENPGQGAELLQQYQLTVSGLKCESCIPDVRKSLRTVPGVRDARVTQFDKTGSLTVVETTPGAVSAEKLVAALNASGFNAEIVSVGEPRAVVMKEESGFGMFWPF